MNQDTYNYDVMGTCLAALQLMVYYRYLPTGQKNAWKVTEEKEEKVTGAAKDDIDVSIDI